jgi:hypothetical protein
MSVSYATMNPLHLTKTRATIEQISLSELAPKVKTLLGATKCGVTLCASICGTNATSETLHYLESEEIWFSEMISESEKCVETGRNASDCLFCES